MKKTFRIVLLVGLSLLAALFLVRSPKAQQGPGGTSATAALAVAGLKPIGGLPLNGPDTSQLNSAFAAAINAAKSVTPGPDAGAQRRAIDNELRAELESFVTNYATSAWTPAVHLLLARRAQLRCGYSLAMDHYSAAFNATAGSQDPIAQSLAVSAGGGLARMLTLTGQIAAYDNLVAQFAQFSLPRPGADWRWAIEMRGWVSKHPDESYKCGLYCLDQLGRLTQPGQFLPKNITERSSSTNGFTAADLLAFAVNVGIRAHAAIMTDSSTLPVPSILHLRSQHFVTIREQRGAFYNVFDPVADGPRWLTAADIAQEATGCVLVSDAVPPQGLQSLTPIDAAAAAAYVGRCHNPLPPDHNDNPCTNTNSCPSSCSCKDPCRPGGSGPPPPPPRPPSSPPPPPPPPSTPPPPSPPPSTPPPEVPPASGATTACPSCSGSGPGMPVWFVSEPFLTLWLSDQPLPSYNPGLGPHVTLRLSYHDRTVPSTVSLYYYWHGAQFGNDAGVNGAWACSWLSFAELSVDENTVELMLPAGNWATFNFPSNSAASSINFWRNAWVEKQGPSGGITNLVLHYPDGSASAYSVSDPTTASAEGLGGLFYMSSAADPTGNQTTFAYDSNFYLTNVTAADGTTFTVTEGDPTSPDCITSVTAAYGSSASFYYVHGRGGPELTNIVDAAGLSSQIGYVGDSDFYTYTLGGAVNRLVTPYGTTTFLAIPNNGIFDRTVQITNALGQQEFYAQLNSYSGSDWPDYTSNVVPTNTPVGTLDTDSGGRRERNTFYWNVQQFAPLIGTDFYSFNWAAFKTGRIRHWLADTDPTYNHWDALSAEQSPSPDGGTTEGEVTFYDYVGKPAGVDYEVGTQIMPSVIARVMPDGSTWYLYSQRLTNGIATQIAEKWVDGAGPHARTNIYVYAANNTDLAAWTNALGVLASSNIYNSYHQVTTNYDALGQATAFVYDATTHQLNSVLYPSGLATTNTYDANHRLQQVVDSPINRTNKYAWNSDGTSFSHTDERSLTITNFWDALHRPSGALYPDGTATTNLYYLLSGTPYPNSSGGTAILDRTATKDRMGFWTYFNYDALRRRVSETNANTVITAYGYCACGGVSYITNAWNTALQAVTTLTYDNQGHATSIVYPDGYTLTSTFDALGRPTASSDGTTSRSFIHDNLGRVTAVTNACGFEQATTFDVLNRPIYATDSNGITVTNSYDNLSRLVSRAYPDGGIEQYGYSARGMTAYTNQLGYTNFYAYDAAGRMTFQTNANNELLRFTNSPAGDLLSLTDGNNHTTKWVYDGYGRVTNKIDQVGSIILRYYYDPDGRLTNRQVASSSSKTKYQYDPVGNLTNIAYPFSGTVKLQYDQLNRLTNMIDSVGTTKYTYTAAGQIVTEIGPLSGMAVTNTYANRFRVGLQASGAWTNGFAYDSVGRLTNVSSKAGSFTSIYYAGPSGGFSSRLVQQLRLPNQSVITNNYDSVGRLLATHLRTSAGVLINKHEYQYDPAGERTNQTRIDGITVPYIYDKIGQLKTAFITGGAAQDQWRYGYDAGWNMTHRTNGPNSAVVTTYTVNNDNELTSPGTFSYDTEGNPLGYNNWTNTFDDENRLIQITALDNSFQTTFAYDGFGRLRTRTEYTWQDNGDGTGQWVWASACNYLWDGWRVIEDSSANYTRGIDLSGTLEGAGGIGGLLARTDGNGSTYYHADGVGNITCMLDGTQSEVATYRYNDPYGYSVTASGSLASANVYRFSSKEIHLNSGFYYYGYRFYDPSAQRWLNRDPIGERGGINLYEIVYNNPSSRVDPFGLDIDGNPLFPPGSISLLPSPPPLTYPPGSLWPSPPATSWPFPPIPPEWPGPQPPVPTPFPVPDPTDFCLLAPVKIPFPSNLIITILGDPSKSGFHFGPIFGPIRSNPGWQDPYLLPEPGEGKPGSGIGASGSHPFVSFEND